MKGKQVLAFLVPFLLMGCLARPLPVKQLLEENGEIYVYSDPFPQEAERLRFVLEGISAFKSDGTEFPLTLVLPEFRKSTLSRQRFVAAGQLPPGEYAGLSFKASQASLKGEQGESTLIVPEKPVPLEFPFTVLRGRALTLSLSFRYAESVPDVFSFQPSFSLSIPGKPLFSLTGYVSNEGSNSITVFDKKSGRVMDVIATGRGPKGMALDQTLGRAYVALSGDDAVEVVDVLAGYPVNRIQLNIRDIPQELALTPDGKTLITANRGSNTVSFIDLAASFETARVNVGDSPRSVIVDAAGKRAYVCNSLSNTLSVIDIEGKTVAATVSTDPGPVRGQFNRKGDMLYVFHEWSPYLSVIDTGSLSVVKRIFVRGGVSAIKVDARTDLLYVARKNEVDVEIYDPLSLVPGDFIRTGWGGNALSIDGEENNLHVVLSGQKRLAIANLVSKKVRYDLDVGEEPYWVVLMGGR